jgi:hypothetical protein
LRVIEDRVLRRVFGAKREEVAESWRRLRNEEPHNLYVSPNVGRVIKSRRRELGIFLFTTASRTALGPTQLPIQWVPGALSLG